VGAEGQLPWVTSHFVLDIDHCDFAIVELVWLEFLVPGFLAN
jgi:hypothetical protein